MKQPPPPPPPVFVEGGGWVVASVVKLTVAADEVGLQMMSVASATSGTPKESILNVPPFVDSGYSVITPPVVFFRTVTLSPAVAERVIRRFIGADESAGRNL